MNSSSIVYAYRLRSGTEKGKKSIAFFAAFLKASGGGQRPRQSHILSDVQPDRVTQLFVFHPLPFHLELPGVPQT